MLLGGKVRDKLAKEKDFGILMMMMFITILEFLPSRNSLRAISADKF